MKCLKGIMAQSSKKVTQSVTQLKCLYTNAHSMGSKQEEPETTWQLESYNLITISETLCKRPHNWNAAAFQKLQGNRKSKQMAALQEKKKKKRH